MGRRLSFTVRFLMKWSVNSASVLQILVCVGLVLVVLPTAAESAHEGIAEIWQPFICLGCGTIEPHAVPYAISGYLYHSLPLVTAQNQTWSNGHGGQFGNRNAAHLAGLEVRSNFSLGTPMGFWGDTLRVVLDVSGIDVRGLGSPPPDSLIAATIECIRATAKPSDGSPGNALRYLEITVEGSAPRKLVFDLRVSYVPRKYFSMGVNK